MQRRVKMSPRDVLALRQVAVDLLRCAQGYGMMGQWLLAATLSEDATRLFSYACQGLEGSLDIEGTYPVVYTRAWRHPKDGDAAKASEAFKKAIDILVTYYHEPRAAGGM